MPKRWCLLNTCMVLFFFGLAAVLGAVGSWQRVFFSTMHHCIGRSAVGLPQYTAPLHVVAGTGPPPVHCPTARGSGHWVFLRAPPHGTGHGLLRLLSYTAALHGAVGSESLAPHGRTAVGSRQGMSGFHFRGGGGGSIEPPKTGGGGSGKGLN